MSAAGKTVVAKELYLLMKKDYSNTILLDGDIFRDLHNNDVDHSIEGRKKNSDRLCRICKFFDEQEINVVGAVLSIFHDAQQWNKDNYQRYFEVYLDVPFEVLVQRDPKKLYERALRGEMGNVVGVDIEFKPPRNPDLVIKNEGQESPREIALRIYDKVKDLL